MWKDVRAHRSVQGSLPPGVGFVEKKGGATKISSVVHDLQLDCWLMTHHSFRVLQSLQQRRMECSLSIRPHSFAPLTMAMPPWHTRRITITLESRNDSMPFRLDPPTVHRGAIGDKEKQEFRRLIGYTDVNNERSWQSPKSFPFTGREPPPPLRTQFVRARLTRLFLISKVDIKLYGFIKKQGRSIESNGLRKRPGPGRKRASYRILFKGLDLYYPATTSFISILQYVL